MANFGTRPSTHVAMGLAPGRPQTGLQRCRNGAGEFPRVALSTMKSPVTRLHGEVTVTGNRGFPSSVDSGNSDIFTSTKHILG